MDEAKRKEISDYADSRAICGDVITARYLRECVDHVCEPQPEFTDEQILEAACRNGDRYDTVQHDVHVVLSSKHLFRECIDAPFIREYFAEKAKQEPEVPQYLIDAVKYVIGESHAIRVVEAVLRAQKEHADA